jgi:hypothetical protein
MILVAGIMFVVALLGFVSSYTVGWLAHILLVGACGLTLTRFINGRTHS